MPLQATSGAASYDAFGGGVAAVPQYIEDVFSCFLYTGNGSTQTITNGIDLSGKGGLTWLKRRDAVRNHGLFDTVRGATKLLYSDLTNAEYTDAYSLTSFNSDGFSLGLDGGGNANGGTYASWTFRKQPKFFDVVTYTGNATAGRTIAHNLGSVPGCIIVKQTGGGGSGGVNNWFVYHRSLGATQAIILESTGAAFTSSSPWNNTTPTSTVFTVGGTSDCNDSGGTYVAYLFAHNAGGFGLTGTDNVISCGSYTGTGAVGNTITLGYEPQWVMIKRASGGTADWRMYDVMRNVGQLEPNTSDAEAGDPLQNALAIQATGFGIVDYTSGSLNANGSTYIYIAIRRGPMKVPTDATKVFIPVFQDTTSNQIVTTNFAVDLSIQRQSNNPTSTGVIDKLRGTSSTYTTRLYTNLTAAEAVSPTSGLGMFNTYMQDNVGARSSMIFWNFQRAPNFFDEVCYTGDGFSYTEAKHNLGIAPELVIIKCRSNASTNWLVTSGFGVSSYTRSNLNLTSAGALVDYSDATYKYMGEAPTATSIFPGNVSGDSNNSYNTSARTYVAYLFATCAGVSKVGSYTGTGATLQVNCGFTAGARFVLIKKTSGTGSWYVWDSARGIVSGNDPYLLLNSTAAEVTNTDYIDTYSAGFEISSTAPSEINENGGSFIFFAVA
jgi:hypothetical protein